MRRLVVWLSISVLAATPVFAQPERKTKSHAPLYGTLIGLAAGVAAGGSFFGLTNCRYGSDSAGVMVACGAVTGGLIAAGPIIGRKIGRHVAKGSAPRRGGRNLAGEGWLDESARLAATVRLRPTLAHDVLCRPTAASIPCGRR